MTTIMAIIAWFQSNWQMVLLSLVAIDQVLIGIFPSVPFFGSLKGILQGLMGSNSNPQLK